MSSFFDIFDPSFTLAFHQFTYGVMSPLGRPLPLIGWRHLWTSPEWVMIYSNIKMVKALFLNFFFVLYLLCILPIPFNISKFPSESQTSLVCKPPRSFELRSGIFFLLIPALDWLGVKISWMSPYGEFGSCTSKCWKTIPSSSSFGRVELWILVF